MRIHRDSIVGNDLRLASRGWRDGMAGNGILMEVPSGRIVASGLSMPHSPRVIDGNL